MATLSKKHAALYATLNKGMDRRRPHGRSGRNIIGWGMKSGVRRMAPFLLCVAPTLSRAQTTPDRAFDAHGQPYENYRSALDDSVDLQGLDFDHHYTLAKIGCGANCIMMAAVDHRGGKVVWFPHVIANWPPSPTNEPVFNNIGSNVITVIGMLDEVGSIGPRRYVFDGRSFTRIR